LAVVKDSHLQWETASSGSLPVMFLLRVLANKVCLFYTVSLKCTQSITNKQQKGTCTTNTASISCWTRLTSLSFEATTESAESSNANSSSNFCRCSLVAWARLT